MSTAIAAEPVRTATWKHLSSAAGDLAVPFPGNQQTASLVFDVDGDGVNDFLVTDRTQSPSVVWFRRTAKGWDRYVVEDTKQKVEAGGAAADIDGDGDLDAVFGGDSQSNQVWWWENPRPAFDPQKPWTRRLIKNSGERQHHDQIFGDFDGDGRPELVFWNQRGQKLFLAEIPANPQEASQWKLDAIWSWPKAFKYEGLAKADLDGDGKEDLIGGGHWFKHLGGTRFEPRKIDDYGMSRSAAGDLVEGGRPEVVLGSGDGVGPLNLYEYRERRWAKRTLIDKVDHGHTLQVADVNGDGHLDVYAAEMHTPGPGGACRQWVLYGDGRGSFITQLVSTGIGNHESRVADLDGDGDLDILDKPYTWSAPRIDVWLNLTK